MAGTHLEGGQREGPVAVLVGLEIRNAVGGGVQLRGAALRGGGAAVQVNWMRQAGGAPESPARLLRFPRQPRSHRPQHLPQLAGNLGVGLGDVAAQEARGRGELRGAAVGARRLEALQDCGQQRGVGGRVLCANEGRAMCSAAGAARRLTRVRKAVGAGERARAARRTCASGGAGSSLGCLATLPSAAA